MNSEELKPCPFCGGDVQFHKDDECSGCHYIQCGGCRAFFDFATSADPENICESVDGLRASIAPMWNRRAEIVALEADNARLRGVAKKAAWMELDTTKRSIAIQDELRAMLSAPDQPTLQARPAAQAAVAPEQIEELCASMHIIDALQRPGMSLRDLEAVTAEKNVLANKVRKLIASYAASSKQEMEK